MLYQERELRCVRSDILHAISLSRDAINRDEFFRKIFRRPLKRAGSFGNEKITLQFVDMWHVTHANRRAHFKYVRTIWTKAKAIFHIYVKIMFLIYTEYY